MKIKSTAFADGGMMPAKYTQEGANVSPPLEISDVPKEAQSLVLICIDPDVPDPAKPVRTFIHWVVYNLPPNTKELPEAVDISKIPGAQEGQHGRGGTGYIGPRPPIGVHRYYFKLYAINIDLKFPSPPTAASVLSMIDGHVVATAETMGRYKLSTNP